MIYLDIPFLLIKILLAIVSLAKMSPLLWGQSFINQQILNIYSTIHMSDLFRTWPFLACTLLWTYSHPLPYHKLLLSQNSPIPFKLAVLGTEAWALHILGKHCTSELHIQPSCLFLYIQHSLILSLANNWIFNNTDWIKWDLWYLWFWYWLV